MAHKNTDDDELVAQYRQVIGFRVRKALGWNVTEWEDVVNEVLTQVLQKLRSGEFRGESSLGTFIYTVTSRRIVDFIRQKSRVLKHRPEPTPLPDPQASVEHKEMAEQLAGLIQNLKPKYRDVLELFYFRELSREEVARRLDITPAKVSERLHYALKLLKKKIIK